MMVKALRSMLTFKHVLFFLTKLWRDSLRLYVTNLFRDVVRNMMQTRRWGSWLTETVFMNTIHYNRACGYYSFTKVIPFGSMTRRWGRPRLVYTFVIIMIIFHFRKIVRLWIASRYSKKIRRLCDTSYFTSFPTFPGHLAWTQTEQDMNYKDFNRPSIQPCLH